MIRHIMFITTFENANATTTTSPIAPVANGRSYSIRPFVVDVFDTGALLLLLLLLSVDNNDYDTSIVMLLDQV